MFQKSETGGGASFTISSDFLLVDRVLTELDGFCERSGVRITFEFKTIVRELLINAVEHGNQKLKTKTVFCGIERLGRGLWRITVEDEGEGFDYASLDMGMPADPLQDRNRGYALINAFSERLEFNLAGNRVSAFVVCQS